MVRRLRRLSRSSSAARTPPFAGGSSMCCGRDDGRRFICSTDTVHQSRVTVNAMAATSGPSQATAKSKRGPSLVRTGSGSGW